jgi:hypothetical protein
MSPQTASSSPRFSARRSAAFGANDLRAQLEIASTQQVRASLRVTVRGSAFAELRAEFSRPGRLSPGQGSTLNTQRNCAIPALLAAVLVGWVTSADAKRLALVIGNDSYQSATPLQNARSDAEAVAEALKRDGFTVTLKKDLTLKAMKGALRSFKEQLSGGDEAVFYFSGHGVQFEGINYLIPTDLAPENQEQVVDESVPLQRVLDDLRDQKARFALAIVDACRDNPFKGTGRAIGGRGLAPVTAATGQMVLYSAGAGQEALDRLGPRDSDPNGVFTRVLLKELNKPGVPAEQVLKNVRDQVVRLARVFRMYPCGSRKGSLRRRSTESRRSGRPSHAFVANADSIRQHRRTVYGGTNG